MPGFKQPQKEISELKAEDIRKIQLYQKGAVFDFSIRAPSDTDAWRLSEQVRNQLPGAIVYRTQIAEKDGSLSWGVDVMAPQPLIREFLNKGEERANKPNPSFGGSVIEFNNFIIDPKEKRMELKTVGEPHYMIEALYNTCKLAGLEVKITSPDAPGELQGVKVRAMSTNENAPDTSQLISVVDKQGWYILIIEKK